MKRTWLVRPDQTIDTLVAVEGGHVPGEPVSAVSHAALAQAVLDGVVLLHRAGGELHVVVQRAPTGVPGERVTSAAAVTWKDHAETRDQPERSGPEIQLEPEETVDGEVLEDGVGIDAFGNRVDEREIPPALRTG